MSITNNTEFWESVFAEKNEMWGFEPSKSAVLAKDLFIKNSINNILIPGIGYGRNAKTFIDNNITVTGIEISKTAINMAKKYCSPNTAIYHGSVVDMPFDDRLFDGIFCHALIHLLDSDERKKLINDCYQQLSEDGCMIFTTISKEAHTYGKGRFISDDRYEIFEGVKIYFYDKESIHIDFGSAGLFQIIDVSEEFPFYLIISTKGKKVVL